MRVRIFQSALNNVRYVLGRLITFQEYQKLDDKAKQQAHQEANSL